MDRRIAELAEYAKEKYGLDGYELKRHELRRSVTPFWEMVYSLELEWFPEGEGEDEYGGFPEGAAIVLLGINSRNTESFTFVGGRPSPGSPRFDDTDLDAIARWVEQETGLAYGGQFKLKAADDNVVQFEAVLHDVIVLPPTAIHVGWNEDGTLTSFIKGGYFPEPELAETEPFMLDLEQVEGMAELELIEMPDYERRRVHPYYTIKELNITQDGTALKFEDMNRGPDNFPVNEILYWEESSNQTFEEQPIEWVEDITADQAFAKEESPDGRPFTEEDVAACKQVLINLLSSEYPDGSGKWRFTALQRAAGKVQAFVKFEAEEEGIIERTILAILDGTDFRLLSYLDDKDAIEELQTYERPEELAVTEQQAFELLRPHLKLTPYYIPDHEQKRYRLHGILNCDYAVDAATGKIIDAEEI